MLHLRLRMKKTQIWLKDSFLIDRDVDDDVEEMVSLQMSRWVMQINPNLAHAKKSLTIFLIEK